LVAHSVALRSREFKLKSGINVAPTGYPIYSVLSLSSPLLRAERVTVFCFRFISLARSSLTKIKIGWKIRNNLLTITFDNPHGPERSPLWLCRFDRITNHESLLTNHPFDALRLLRAGLSPFTSLSDIALATSDHGRASGPAILTDLRYRPPFELRATGPEANLDLKTRCVRHHSPPI
jgi:hypothetical protein